VVCCLLKNCCRVLLALVCSAMSSLRYGFLVWILDVFCRWLDVVLRLWGLLFFPCNCASLLCPAAGWFHPSWSSRLLRLVFFCYFYWLTSAPIPVIGYLVNYFYTCKFWLPFCLGSLLPLFLIFFCNWFTYGLFFVMGDCPLCFFSLACTCCKLDLLVLQSSFLFDL